MKVVINILSALSIIASIVQGVIADNDFPYKTIYKNIEKKEVKNVANENEDNFYMIFVNNTINSDGNHSKRSDIDQLINEMAIEINDIIIENKDTYEDTSKLEEFEQKNTALEKRSNLDKRNEEESPKLAYPISTVKDKTIIYSYLSKAVVDKLEGLPYVMACVPDVKLTLASIPVNDTLINNSRQIKKETKWKGVNIKEKADTHLSMISQGKYDDQLIGEYDQNYYYPSSAGKDVDVFILDNGFNFRHSEFSNKDERTTKCIFKVENAKIVESDDDEFCENSKNYHGEKISDIVGGLIHGLAPKVNIYGVAMEEKENEEDSIDQNRDPTEYSEAATTLLSYFIAAMQQIRDKYFRPNKAIFNFSYGIALSYFKEEDKYIIDYWEELINEMAEEGAIFVAAAGNEGIQVDQDDKPFFYPCSYENVICVGGVDNYGKNPMYKLEKEINAISRQLMIEFDNELYAQGSALYAQYMILKSELAQKFVNKTIDTSFYEAASFSNYGKKVDIYAPAFVNIEYQDQFGEDIADYDVGASYSSPIVVGVAATVMSENPKKKFNTKSMLKQLSKIGEKNVLGGILDGNPNILINNGKHVVYSQNGVYNGCGIRSGNRKCSKGLHCSKDGYCLAKTKGKIEILSSDEETSSEEEVATPVV